jgi:predicted nucleic acid-binding protein
VAFLRTGVRRDVFRAGQDRYADADALAAGVISTGRKPRGRVADLMIASIAAANRLPLFTTNPADFPGPESVVTVVPVPVPI